MSIEPRLAFDVLCFVLLALIAFAVDLAFMP